MKKVLIATSIFLISLSIIVEELEIKDARTKENLFCIAMNIFLFFLIRYGFNKLGVYLKKDNEQYNDQKLLEISKENLDLKLENEKLKRTLSTIQRNRGESL